MQLNNLYILKSMIKAKKETGLIETIQRSFLKILIMIFLFIYSCKKIGRHKDSDNNKWSKISKNNQEMKSISIHYTMTNKLNAYEWIKSF